MTDFNSLVTQDENYLRDAFSPIIEGVLTWDEKGPLEESRITSITVHEPANDFDTCYKFSLSYEYTVDIGVEVENLETNSIVYTDTLTVRIPKFNANGFIFKTSDRVGQARFRSPFIKANKKAAVYLFNDTLYMRSNPSIRLQFGDNMVEFFENNEINSYPVEEFDFSKSKLHENARAKLSLMFNRKFGDNLTKEDFYFLKSQAETEDGVKKLKMDTPLDFEFNDITRVFLKECIKIGTSKGRKINRNNSWRKYKKLYASNIQYCINSIFSIGDWSDVNTADETNSLTTEMQADKIYFYNSKGAQMQLDFTPSYIGVVCPVDTPETNLVSKKNEKAIGSKFINGEPYIEVYTKEFEKKTISLIEYYFSKVLISDCINYDLKKVKPNIPLTCKSGIYSDMVQVDSLKDVNYFDTEPYNRLSLAVSLVPGVNSTDQIKASIGAKMLGQATSCNGSQRAIVYTGTENLVYSRSDKVIKAPEDCRVISVSADSISVETADGPKLIDIPEDKNLSDGTVQHYTVDIKPGQVIKKGQEIASTGEFKSGEFAPYINLNVAMWNYGGFDHLDGVILTEKSIKKCAVRRKGSLFIDITNKGKYVFNLKTIRDTFTFGGINEDEMFKNLDEFGLIKAGSKIETLDILCTYGHSRTAKNLVQELLSQANPDDLESKTEQVPEGVMDGIVNTLELQINRKFADNPIVNLLSMHFNKSGYHVYNVTTNEANLVARIAIYYDYWDIPKIGDKFSNRWASKATISYIIPENEIPYDEDGNEIECIMAPESIWKRKNPKQITSLQLGRLGSKAYKEAQECIAKGNYDRVRFILTVMNQDESYKELSDKDIDKIMDDLSDIQCFRTKVSSMDYKYTNKVVSRMFKQLGYQEKLRVYIPGEDKWTRSEVVVGKESMMRLHFIVQDRAKATSGIFSTGEHFIGGYGSSRDAGQKIGDMTTWAIMANNELDVYDYLTNHVGEKFRDEFVNNLAWIGLELKKTEPNK